MIACLRCGKKEASEAIGLCLSCLKSEPASDILSAVHLSRQKYNLPPSPPYSSEGKTCWLCANECRLSEGQTGFCGIRVNQKGKILWNLPPRTLLAYAYYDPLPTNCCAAWFCPGSREKGVNLAVFLYGCNFDCLFCQNASHRWVKQADSISFDDLIKLALNPGVRCVCFFGGSPEPQLPLAIQVSREIIRRSPSPVHICWEWNGAGHPALVQRAAELSRQTGGTVKFDLKAWTQAVGKALCGVPLQRTYENLSRLGGIFPQPNLLTATTLLVPYYVEESEVEEIARFLASINRDFPYSLLVFHPDDRLKDLPITPRSQVKAAYRAARRHLNLVNIGNLHLLGGWLE